ncbi:MAG: hypothetical protein NVS9B1_12430 [Candidatus Dormibacteraceae bacterium]
MLEGAQGERATGTLLVKTDEEAYTLYFLFGHLFHATGQGANGDDAVVGALRCHDGDFAFDAKAKLPSDETVKSSIPELLNAASENGTGPGSSAATNEAPVNRAESGYQEPVAAPANSTAEAGGSAEAGVDRPERTESGETSSRKGVKHRPQPKHGREPIPVPAGEVVYDSLKTSFVDFPRLITTLENEGYTGYVRLLTEGASGLILFREGTAQECVFDAGEPVRRGHDALLAFNEEVTHGHGVLDVVGLPAEIVDGLYDLVVAKPVYTELYASWVDMPALLKYLAEKKLTGSVMVRGTAGTGIIILTEGKATGAYTSESRTIENDSEVVLSLCSDRNAMIEVKAADHDHGRPPLDVDEIVGSRGHGKAAAAPPPATAPQPAPQPAPAAAAPTTELPQSVGQTASMPAFPSEPTPPVGQTASLPAFRPEAVPAVEPAAAPEAPGPSAKPAPNWDVVIEELQGMADRALGARSRKVKDLLGGAERSQAGVDGAVSQVSQISLLFVDSALLVKLEQDMRAQLQQYL